MFIVHISLIRPHSYRTLAVGSDFGCWFNSRPSKIVGPATFNNREEEN